MANREHVELLDSGVTAWNAWRDANPSIQPDLSSVHFGGVDHSIAGHVRPMLTELPYRGTFLLAELNRANLRNANLNGSNFVGAKLREADLQDASLIATDFTNADLSMSNVKNAWFLETRLHGTYLKDIKGLQTAHFLGQCQLNEATVRNSWPMEESILTAFGLSVHYASFLKNVILASSSISCFLSHSSRDVSFATKLYEQLSDYQVKCWMASKDLPIGARIRDTVHESISDHQKMIIVLSTNSIQSQWVESEVEWALECERQEESTVLFPVRIDDEIWQTNKGWAQYIKNTRNIGDFCDWEDSEVFTVEVRRLIRDLAGSIPEGTA